MAKNKVNLIEAFKKVMKGSSDQKKWLIICCVSIVALLVWWLVNLVQLVTG